MANLFLTLGVTILSFCVATFFTITFANVVEYLLAKHDVERFIEDDIQIVKATKDDCCCHECCGCQECYHSHSVESIHDEEE